MAIVAKWDGNTASMQPGQIPGSNNPYGEWTGNTASMHPRHSANTVTRTVRKPSRLGTFIASAVAMGGAAAVIAGVIFAVRANEEADHPRMMQYEHANPSRGGGDYTIHIN